MTDRQHDQEIAPDLATFAVNTTTIVTVVFFALGLSFASIAGLFGLPLALVLSAMFSSYLFVILEQASRGRREPPPLALELINVFRLRPLGVFAVLIAGVTLVGAAMKSGTVAGIAALIVTGALVPALICIVVVADNPFLALLPPGILRFVSVLGLRYAQAIGLIVGLIIVVAILASFLPNLALAAIVLYALLLIFRLLGHAMYLCRHELGIEAIEAPEVTEVKEQRVHEKALKACLDDVHIFSQTGRYPQAIDILTAFVDNQDDVDAAEAWFLGRLLQWEKTQVGVLFARRAISRQFAGRDLPQALEICEKTLNVQPNFCPVATDEAETLARYARESGKKKRAYQILRNSQESPGLTGSGHTLAARIASEDLGNWTEAAKHAATVLRQQDDQITPEDRTLCETILKVSSGS